MEKGIMYPLAIYETINIHLVVRIIHFLAYTRELWELIIYNTATKNSKSNYSQSRSFVIFTLLAHGMYVHSLSLREYR